MKRLRQLFDWPFVSQAIHHAVEMEYGHLNGYTLVSIEHDLERDFWTLQQSNMKCNAAYLKPLGVEV